MDKLIIVLIETSVALMFFYLAYVLWLKNETFFKGNRLYLLLTAGFSLLIPWINLSIPTKPGDILLIYNLLDTVSVTASAYEQSLVQQLTSLQWILIVYLLGVFVMLSVFVSRLIKITRISKTSPKTVETIIPTNVCFVDVDVVPFSFLNKIYINPNTFSQKQINDIIAHESVHINQQHTYDCLFYELLIVFFWFNPIVYKYRTSAKEIHEYLADEGAIRSGVSGVRYKTLLFEQATGLTMLTLPNSFNYSLLKRRLIMLTKIRSSKWTKIRLVFIVPILLGLIMVFACNKGEETACNNKDALSKVVNAEVLNKEVYLEVEVMPEFEGGFKAVKKFIASEVKYPKDAKENGIEGRVFVEFCVDVNGEVCDAKVARGVNDLLDAEALRVVSSLPNWIPGKDNGKKVKVQYTIPINFALN